MSFLPDWTFYHICFLYMLCMLTFMEEAPAETVKSPCPLLCSVEDGLSFPSDLFPPLTVDGAVCVCAGKHLRWSPAADVLQRLEWKNSCSAACCSGSFILPALEYSI